MLFRITTVNGERDFDLYKNDSFTRTAQVNFLFPVAMWDEVTSCRWSLIVNVVLNLFLAISIMLSLPFPSNRYTRRRCRLFLPNWKF